jgi:hypothetical protein
VIDAQAPALASGAPTAAGVALFDVPAAMLAASTLPLDALVYGGPNTDGLVGPDGQPLMPVAGTAAGASLERMLPNQWVAQPAPTPNICRVVYAP